jgi:hypothetical protein
MTYQRRTFLKQLASFSAMASLPAIAQGRDSSNVTLVINFSGPFAFVPAADGSFTVCAPEITGHRHFPSVSTDSGSGQPLDPAQDYSLTNLPVASGSLKTFIPPIQYPLGRPVSEAAANSQIVIKLKRPNIIRGIDQVKVTIKDARGSSPQQV